MSNDALLRLYLGAVALQFATVGLLVWAICKLHGIVKIQSVLRSIERYKERYGDGVYQPPEQYPPAPKRIASPPQGGSGVPERKQAIVYSCQDGSCGSCDYCRSR